MAMVPSTVLRISSVDALYRAIEDASDVTAKEALGSCSDFDSSGGCALLGTLRVATHAEKYARAPFRLPAGSLVFADNITRDVSNQPLQCREIRCLASMARVSWFTPTVRVLLTHWRYIAHPTPLRGVEAAAWAYIEILSAPVLLSEDFHLPRIGRPLSWWMKHQIHPELSEEHNLFNAINKSPPLSSAKITQLLTQQSYDSQLSNGTNPESSAPTQHLNESRLPYSVMGRVRATSAIFSSNGEPAYVVSMALEASTSSDCRPTLVPLYMHGQRFLGLYVSISVDESLFVTDLQTTMVRDGPDKTISALVTSSISRAFRIDEFDGLDESLILPPVSQTPFTQNSQDSLISQIASHSTATTTASGLQDSVLPSTGSNANNDQCSAPQVVTTSDRHLVICKDRLECYEGDITRIVDAALGIYVVDDTHLLMLTFWQKFSPLFVLRPGSRVVLDNMHVFMLVDSDFYQWSWIKRAFPDKRYDQGLERRVLIFGACPYASIRVVRFPETSQPAEFPSLIFSGLSSMVVERACSLVQMIEILESFWKLCIKFPSGFQVSENRTEMSAREIARQNMQMALNLAGDTPEEPAHCSDRCWVVSNHHRTCNIDRLAPGHSSRVIALRNVVRSFTTWRERQSAQLDPDATVKGTEGARLTNVFPAELNLEGFPLIGSAYIICVRDASRIRICDSSMGSVRSGQEDVVVCELESVDHIHPAVVVGEVADSGSAYNFTADDGIQAIVPYMTTVRLEPTSDSTWKHMQTLPAFSVCDLFKCIAIASTPETSENLSANARCVPNAIISIHGIILSREVKKSVMFATGDRNQENESNMQPAVGLLENHITLQDEMDSTKTVVVYVKLTTFSHPLGLVPGTHVVFRDVIFNVSKSTGNPYLSGTYATSVDEVVINSEVRHLVLKNAESENAGDPTTVCIGQLYTKGHSSLRDRVLKLNCYVNSVESLKLVLVCETCQNTVQNMSCACAQKRHRLVSKRRGGSDVLQHATVRAETEMLCMVSDGSGIAWVVTTREDDIVGILGLSSTEMEQLYKEAAQSLNGQLLWKPQQSTNGQPSDGSNVLTHTAASAAGVSILVEGTAESKLAVKRQPLRMDGQNVTINKHMISTITAMRVARPAAVDLCWSLLQEL
ncbi:hypothetical protein H4S08_004093 [Coemansia sp. RSA 1365]|nr:hypothetical protein H4S08_004093 [Coemansia sp. RSA 1365]